MYDELADYWHLLSAVEDYEEEAEVFRRAITEHARGPTRSLIELGSGGGNNAYHLRHHFELTLVDLSARMLEQSRKINPTLPHLEGDMRDFRLYRRFDVVFIHDAISYLTSQGDLARAMVTAREHCVDGGVALFCPDETRETFEPETDHGGHDADDGRALRYLQWVWDPDPKDETIVTDFSFLIRNAAGQVRAVHERHLHGLFPRQVWLDTMAEAGFEPHAEAYEHSDLPDGYELFIGIAR
jgi:hypothetical protein